MRVFYATCFITKKLQKIQTKISLQNIFSSDEKIVATTVYNVAPVFIIKKIDYFAGKSKIMSLPFSPIFLPMVEYCDNIKF